MALTRTTAKTLPGVKIVDCRTASTLGDSILKLDRGME
jgi:hypothetical protein